MTAAVQHVHAALCHPLGGAEAHLFHLARVGATDQGCGHLQRMAAQPGADVVGQGVVDGGFHFAVKGQAAPFGQFLTGRGFGAVADVVGQRLRVPGSKHRLGGEVLLSGIGIRPFLPATVAGGAGGETVHQRRLLAQPHQAGAPAAQHGRIQHHHALGQFWRLCRSHQAEDAAHGVA